MMALKCCTRKEWELSEDKKTMIPTKICSNDAAFLLSSNKWKDMPYCKSCSLLMIMAATRWGWPIEVEKM